jgi:hypothetical protein
MLSPNHMQPWSRRWSRANFALEVRSALSDE